MEKGHEKKQIFTWRNILLVAFCLFCVYLIADYFVWKNGANVQEKTTNTKPLSKLSSWTEKEKNALTDTCFIKSPLSLAYPEIIQVNCSCLTAEMIKKYTPQECAEMGKLSIQERSKILKEIILHCAKISGRDTLKYTVHNSK